MMDARFKSSKPGEKHEDAYFCDIRREFRFFFFFFPLSYFGVEQTLAEGKKKPKKNSVWFDLTTVLSCLLSILDSGLFETLR